MALGAIEALRSRGVRVPDDISICGSGNTVAGQLGTPPLTTVDADHEAVGRKSAEVLLDLIERRAARATPPELLDYSLPAFVIARESTAPPRRRPEAA